MTAVTVPALDGWPEPLVCDWAEDLAGGLSRTVFNEARTHRYLLVRSWQTDLPVMTWIMLNPSTADAFADDPYKLYSWAFSRLMIIELLSCTWPGITAGQSGGSLTSAPKRYVMRCADRESQSETAAAYRLTTGKSSPCMKAARRTTRSLPTSASLRMWCVAVWSGPKYRHAHQPITYASRQTRLRLSGFTRRLVVPNRSASDSVFPKALSCGYFTSKASAPGNAHSFYQKNSGPRPSAFIGEALPFGKSPSSLVSLSAPSRAASLRQASHLPTGVARMDLAVCRRGRAARTTWCGLPTMTPLHACGTWRVTSWNTVSSWRDTLDDRCYQAKRCITSTMTDTTTGWRTCRFASGVTARAMSCAAPTAGHHAWNRRPCSSQLPRAGHPRHPLYVRADAPLIPWEPPS